MMIFRSFVKVEVINNDDEDLLLLDLSSESLYEVGYN